MSVGGGENKLSLGLADGAPKLKAGLDDVVVSPPLSEETPNPKPTGFPILPPGFPKVNGFVLGGEALPKKVVGLSEEDPKMLVDVEVDVSPKRLVLPLELSVLSDGGGVKSDGLLDSVVPLLPKAELPNTEVGLDIASELNALVGLGAKKFGTLPEPKLGAVEAGRDEAVDEPSVSWLVGGTDLDVPFSTPEGVPNEKPEIGGVLEIEKDVFEAPNVKTDFGGSGAVDEDVSLGLGEMPKGSCAGLELEGGTNGAKVKPVVFVPLSLVAGNLGDASTAPTGGLGMENNVVFSSDTLGPNRGVELDVEPRPVGGCEEASKSDWIVVRRFL